MKARLAVLGAILLGAGLMLFTPITAVFLTPTAISTGVDDPIGIDWNSATNDLLISQSWPDGEPINFNSVNRNSGARAAFGSTHGWVDEIYFATVRPGQPGGWTVGNVYSAQALANGANTQFIAQLNSVGTVTNPTFTTLNRAPATPENRLKRGGITFDRYNVPGLNGALVVVASNDIGQDANPVFNAPDTTVYKVTSGGVASIITTLPGHSEGVAVVPDDAATYGAWAGKILVGREPSFKFAAIDPQTGQYTENDVQFAVEDIWVVPPSHDFYGVDHNENAGPGTIWKIDAKQWSDAGLVGKILFAQEHGAQLAVRQNPSDGGQILLSPNPVQQWEHITFAPAPNVDIIKFTNGVDANDPNAPGVPNISPGGTVTWTYRVTNTGAVPVPQAQVVVTDNTTGVTPTFTSVITGNADNIFDPGEVWLYTATGTALDLAAPPPAGTTIVTNSCTANNSQPPRNAYTNVGTVTIPGASDTDPSSYCNPVPGVDIIKFTNGQDANDPDGSDVPNVVPGGAITWTYRVTNTGGSSVPRANVSVTDNVTGVTPAFDSEISGNGDTIFNPGEVWLYKATGTALNLAAPPPAGTVIVAGKCQHNLTQPPRNAYTNVGTVQIPGASDTDPSSYCNPPPTPGVDIIKFTNGADANLPGGSDVPDIAIGGTVTWTYKVTNTGSTSPARVDVVVTDNVTGVTPTFDTELSGNGDTIFNPGEVWQYKATGTALNLAQPPPPGNFFYVTNATSCSRSGSRTPSTAYTNIGTVTIPGATDTDPSSYCNSRELPCPAGSFTYSFSANGDLNIVYDQFPAPNDNSYGANAVGWGTKGHTFGNLTGSDKAGFQLVDAGGVVRLDFTIDYLTSTTASAAFPSGFKSFGPFGGDGDLVTGTLTPADLTWDTSLSRNLNGQNIPGLFAGGAQQFGTGVANVLVDSPPTVDKISNYTLTPAAVAAGFGGWDFHDTYFVTIKAAKLAALGFNAATWKVQPNADELHNSPAKPCPSGGGGACALNTGSTTIKDKTVKIEVTNTGTGAAVLSDLILNWPAANGKLTKIKLDGDVVYDNPDLPAPSATLTSANLTTDEKKKRIDPGKTRILTFEFEKNAAASPYDITAKFGAGCQVTFNSTNTGMQLAACSETKPIEQLVLEYSGAADISNVAFYRTNATGTPGAADLIGNSGALQTGDIFSFGNYAAANATNDVDFLITFVGGATQKSRFHLSCSDSDMNDITDCGKVQGNGKDNSVTGGNLWLLRDIQGQGKHVCNFP